MNHVKAVYRRGVFEPLEPVDMREEQRVDLSIALAGESTPQQWVDALRSTQAKIIKRYGLLPDSSGDIAEDRQR